MSWNAAATMAADAAELCAELADLHAQLGAAVSPDTPAAPDRSSRVRPALLWCTTHSEPHRRDEWRDADTDPPVAPEDRCVPGQDPRRAGVLTAPALTPTAPRYSVRRRVPTSSAPLDVDVLSAQRAVGDAALLLAREARHALGDLSREWDPLVALARLPMLLGRLGAGHPVVRQALGAPARDDVPAYEGVLARRRRTARYALELDRRPVALAPCPSVQLGEYAATYSAGPEVTATWADGVCREYDAEASLRATQVRREVFDAAIATRTASPVRPHPHEPLRIPRTRTDRITFLAVTSPGFVSRETEPVEVWVRSVLFVRDPAAPPESDGAAYRCPGCGRVWRTAAEKRQLHALLWAEDEEVDRMAEATRAALYSRLAAAMRAAAGMAPG